MLDGANEDNAMISKHMKDLLTIYISDYTSLSQFCHVASFQFCTKEMFIYRGPNTWFEMSFLYTSWGLCSLQKQ